jgi:hypothetical protein
MGTMPPNGVYMVVIEPRPGGGTFPVSRAGRMVHARPIRLVTTPSHARTLQATDAANARYTFSISYRMRQCPTTALLVVDGRGVALADDTADSDCTYNFEGFDREMAEHIQRRFGVRRRDVRASRVLPAPQPVPLPPGYHREYRYEPEPLEPWSGVSEKAVGQLAEH